jgi:hypothetical protein
MRKKRDKNLQAAAPGDVLVENTTFIRFVNQKCCPVDDLGIADATSILQAIVMHNRVRVCPDDHLFRIWAAFRKKKWAEVFKPASFYYFMRNPEGIPMADEYTIAGALELHSHRGLVGAKALLLTLEDLADAGFCETLRKTFSVSPATMSKLPKLIRPDELCSNLFISEDGHHVFTNPFNVDQVAIREWDMADNWQSLGDKNEVAKAQFLANEVFRTNLYLLLSAKYSIPYLPNALRYPLIRYKSQRLSEYSGSLSQFIIKELDQADRKRAAAVNKAFETTKFTIATPWLVRLYLDRLRKVNDPLEALASLRNDAYAKDLRKWIAKVDRYVIKGNLGKAAKAVNQVSAIADEWRGKKDSPVTLTGELLNATASLLCGQPLSAAATAVKKAGSLLERRLRKRHLIYLVRAGKRAGMIANEFSDVRKKQGFGRNYF